MQIELTGCSSNLVLKMNLSYPENNKVPRVFVRYGGESPTQARI